MSVSATGNLARHFMTTQRLGQVKDRLATLGQELGSGRVSDVTLHLGADTGRLAHIDHRSRLIDTHLTANRETSEMLSRMQLSLEKIDSRRSELSEHVLSLPVSITDQQRQGAATAARINFSAMIGDLNVRVADRTLFAGTATEGAALIDPDTMLNDIAAAAAGATTAADVATAVTNWFSDPGGGFETLAYLGESGEQTRPLGDGTSARIDVRADRGEVRSVLAATAMTAVLDLGIPGLSTEEANDVVRDSGGRLIGAAQPFAVMRGELGRVEALVDSATTRQATEQATLDMLRNDMISTDPAETAAQLQEVQTQLEMNYLLTARLAGMTLSDYIR